MAAAKQYGRPSTHASTALMVALFLALPVCFALLFVGVQTGAIQTNSDHQRNLLNQGMAQCGKQGVRSVDVGLIVCRDGRVIR